MKLLDRFPGPWSVDGQTGEVRDAQGNALMTLAHWLTHDPYNADLAGPLARAMSRLPLLLKRLEDRLHEWPEYEGDDDPIQGSDMVECAGGWHREDLSLLGAIEPEAAESYRKWAREALAEREALGSEADERNDEDEEDA